jgi:hypothetical protein
MVIVSAWFSISSTRLSSTVGICARGGRAFVSDFLRLLHRLCEDRVADEWRESRWPPWKRELDPDVGDSVGLDFMTLRIFRTMPASLSASIGQLCAVLARKKGRD